MVEEPMDPEEYFTPPVRDNTLREILEGESWVPPSAPHTPTPPHTGNRGPNTHWVHGENIESTVNM